MLQKQMESMSMIVMTQMGQFVKKNVILQNARETDYIQIEIYIATD